jgi:N-acetylmuramoyl-L-alanine amidase
MLSEIILCLALNVYHEARGELDLGKYAVAHVTINRAKLSGESICDEVYKKGQFSWTKNRKKPLNKDGAWHKAIDIAQKSLQKEDITGGALYFNSVRLQNKNKNTLRIGNHFFFKKAPNYYNKRKINKK